MLLFSAQGQLGNQIFQYLFLKTIQKNNEKLVLSGFNNLQEVFAVSEFLHIDRNSRLKKVILYRLIEPLLSFLADKKIISSIDINHEDVLQGYIRESTTYTTSVGLFGKIVYVKLGFFQSEDFFERSIAQKLTINNNLTIKSEHFLLNVPHNAYKVFVHIRRGDYVNHKVYGQSVMLPITYYKEQIAWFLRHRQNCYFIFLSDDSSFVDSEFGYLNNKLISVDNHYGVDFAIITKCQGGIMSPSSFSWWGSYLMEDRDVVFAPKYWLGFNAKKEYHKHGTPSFARVVEL